MKYIASSALLKKVTIMMSAVLGLLMLNVASAQNAKTSSAEKATKTTTAATTTTDSKGTIKIGFVNTEKILRDSKPAKDAQKKIEEEFKQRDSELQKLANNMRSKYENFDKNAPVMTDADRAKAQRELGDMDTELQRKRREFQEDFNRRRNEAFSGIVDKANAAIRDIASKESYDLILQDAVTVSNRVDITSQVIEVLDKK